MASPPLPKWISNEDEADASLPGTGSRFSRFARNRTFIPGGLGSYPYWGSTAFPERGRGRVTAFEAIRFLNERPGTGYKRNHYNNAFGQSRILQQYGGDFTGPEFENGADFEQDDDLRDDQHTDEEYRNFSELQEMQQSSEDSGYMRGDIIIAIMGVTGAGKSTFISLLSDQDIEIGHGQSSCTTNVGVYHFTLEGVRIWLIDTPGFDDTNRSDTEVLGDIAYWLANAYTRDMQLAGIIYLHRITDVRMQGSTLRNLRLFKKLCGRDELRSVVLATTHWTHGEGNTVSEAVGQARVEELKTTREFWGGMIERGSRVEKHDGSKASALRIVSDLANRHEPVTLKIQRQMVDEERTLLETAAGQELHREMIEERKRAAETLKKLQLDMELALQEKDKEWQEMIKQDRAELQARIEQRTQEMMALKVNLTKLAAEKDEQFRKMERKWNREKAALEERLQREMVIPRNAVITPLVPLSNFVPDPRYRDLPSPRDERSIERSRGARDPSRSEMISRYPPVYQRYDLTHDSPSMGRVMEARERELTAREELEYAERRYVRYPESQRGVPPPQRRVDDRARIEALQTLEADIERASRDRETEEYRLQRSRQDRDPRYRLNDRVDIIQDAPYSRRTR